MDVATLSNHHQKKKNIKTQINRKQPIYYISKKKKSNWKMTKGNIKYSLSSS